MAAGRLAKAHHDGSFIWRDSEGAAHADSFSTIAENEFAARAVGGFRFVTGSDGVGNPTAGVKLAAGDSVWTTLNGTPIGSNGWGLSGNSGIDPAKNFIGTLDSLPLEFRVNNEQAFRIELSGGIFDSSMNITAGYKDNNIVPGSIGSTIGGGGSKIGGANSITGDHNTIAGGTENTVVGSSSVISGGGGHNITTVYGTIGGGEGNTVEARHSTIGGGAFNIARVQTAQSRVAAVTVHMAQTALQPEISRRQITTVLLSGVMDKAAQPILLIPLLQMNLQPGRPAVFVLLLTQTVPETPLPG